jgi:RNA polymerase sigma-70 factor, ECF subfamily
MSVATDRHEVIRLLFEQYAGELYRYIQCSAPSDIDPQDVVQETFIRAFKSLHQLRNNSMARAWLYRIARNYLYDLLRKRRLEIRQMQFEPSESSTGGIESSLEILDAMKSLPIHYQQVLYLHAVKEFSVQEVAEVLSKTPVSIRVMLHRARKSLAIQLGLNASTDCPSKGGTGI